jgi:hypothetical protein
MTNSTYVTVGQIVRIGRLLTAFHLDYIRDTRTSFSTVLGVLPP